MFILVLICAALAGPALAEGNGNGQGNGNPPRQANSSGQGSGSNGNAGNGQNSNENAGSGRGNGSSASPTPPSVSLPGRPGIVLPSSPSAPGRPAVPGISAPAQGQADLLSQDEALGAVSRGQAEPLADLARDAIERTGGQIIDASLLRQGSILVYAIRVLSPDGRLTTEYYYANSGIFIGTE